ncbi:dephospho-CoA kinase [Bartonella sp. AR 15-3]|nr:dephospho-CoA kinase [Bartonella sp. AR 15-3]
MGKSTAADFFKQAGVPVFSADEAVHKLYSSELTVSLIERAFPGVTENNLVNRMKLSDILVNNSKKLKILEKIIHPLVQKKEEEFINIARQQKKKLVVLDIPLLFETKSENRVNSIVVVSSPPEIQKARAMNRPNMNEEKFSIINTRQVSDKQKRKCADFVINTGKDLEDTRQQVLQVIKSLLKDASKES